MATADRYEFQFNTQPQRNPYPEEQSPGISKREKKKRRAVRRARIDAVQKASSKVKDRNLIFFTFLLIGAIAIGLICSVAYSESIKHDINKAHSEIASIQEEIDNLNLKIEEGKNIGTIEKKALRDLGMVYPTADQFKYVDEIKPMKEDMAQVIRGNAYEY